MWEGSSKHTLRGGRWLLGLIALLLLILTFNFQQLNLVFLYDPLLPQNLFCPGVIDTVGKFTMFTLLEKTV